ncbi:unnamed protein product [Aphanomyces euteiches]|nr:hypothetical protein Ae201684P_005369 [Aphanomyces euteiches]
MNPKAIKSYARSDCSGGLVFLRVGASVSRADVYPCTNGVEVNAIQVTPTQFIKEATYMELTRPYSVDTILDTTCAFRGDSSGFAFVNCTGKAHHIYEDANCTDVLTTIDLVPPAIKCWVPRQKASAMPWHTDPPIKFLKKYSNNDCTGHLEYVAEMTGALARAQVSQPCVNGFVLHLASPVADDYLQDGMYMATNLTAHGRSMILNGTCVAYAPSR